MHYEVECYEWIGGAAEVEEAGAGSGEVECYALGSGVLCAGK